MQIRAFTLVEILLSILLIGILYFLSIKLTYKNEILIKDYYKYLYPNGEMPLPKCKVYNYYDDKLKEINKKNYVVKNGIGESFILECNKAYLFLPFEIREFNTTNEILDYFENLRDIY